VRALVEKELARRCGWEMIMRRIFHRSYPLKIKMFQFDEILWITFIISFNYVTMLL